MFGDNTPMVVQFCAWRIVLQLRKKQNKEHEQQSRAFFRSRKKAAPAGPFCLSFIVVVLCKTLNVVLQNPPFNIVSVLWRQR
jgi:hypothetical protein